MSNLIEIDVVLHVGINLGTYRVTPGIDKMAVEYWESDLAEWIANHQDLTVEDLPIEKVELRRVKP